MESRKLPYGFTVQKLKESHKSLPANPLIADPMYWKGYIEKVGTGTEDIIEKCRNYGLKMSVFYQVRVVIWRANGTLSDPEIIKLTALIKSNSSISRAELARELGISERQTRKIIDQLRADGTLLRKGGRYSCSLC